MQIGDLLNAPWAIVPERLHELQEIYAARLAGGAWDEARLQAVEARIGRPLRDDRDQATYTLEGPRERVAVVAVEGVMAPKANLFMRISGGASTRMIAANIAHAADNSGVDAILLEVSSPGGSVFGIPELYDAIRAASERKPIVAWTFDQMASAAYFVSAAADEIYISSGHAMLGSIGVVMEHVDYSKAQERSGIKRTEIFAGRYKRIASDNGPLSEEGRAYLQAQVDTYYTQFVDAVARGRGATPEQVLERMADGRIFIGQAAIDAGLADGMMSREALLEKLSAAAAPSYQFPRATHSQGKLAQIVAESPTGAPKPMNNEHPSAPLTPDALKTQAPDLYAAVFDAGRAAAAEASAAATNDAVCEAVAAERRRVAAIEAIAIPGFDAIVNAAKANGTSPEATAVAILEAQRAQTLDRARQIAAEAPKPAPLSAAADEPEALPAKIAKARAAADKDGVPFHEAWQKMYGNVAA